MSKTNANTKINNIIFWLKPFYILFHNPLAKAERQFIFLSENLMSENLKSAFCYLKTEHYFFFLLAARFRSIFLLVEPETFL